MKLILPKYFTLVGLICILSSCNGQVKQKKIEDNITIGKIENPNGNVYCGFLDKDDNLWFGTTNDGVYKFDGSNFVHFTEKDGLSNNKISCIYQVDNGDLWFGTANGISIFNGTKFTHLNIPEYKISTDWLKKSYPMVNPNEVQSIVQDKNGMYWIGTNGAGAYRYDGKSFTNHLLEIGDTMPDGLYHNVIQKITEDNYGNLWFASMSHGGVHKFDGKTFTQYMPKDGLSDDQVRTIIVDSKGIIWFGFNGNRESGLTSFNGNSFQTFTEKDGLCTKNVRAIYEDTQGNLWVGGMQGFCVYNGKEFTRFVDDKNVTYERIVFIVGDKEDNIWFGGTNGFWKYDGEVVTDMTRRNK